MTPTFYKFINEDGTTIQQNAKWHLPKNGKPGAWMPKIKGDLIACENGYHLCRQSTDLLDWCNAPTLYTAEWRHEIVEDDDKVVVRQARLLSRVETWNERTARLFACDCAEQALKLIKQPDKQSINAVRVGRLFAVGDATRDELSAAWAAARSAAALAAGSAAWFAAGSAAWFAAGSAAAWAVAGSAAWFAAGSAAGSAARSAAVTAARKWQLERLMFYLNGEQESNE